MTVKVQVDGLAQFLEDTKSYIKVISFYIDKGGTGKSTHAYNFSCYCAEVLKKRVLVVDGDRSANITDTFGVYGELAITNVLRHEEFEIYHTSKPNIDIICGGSDFTDKGTDIDSAGTSYLEMVNWLSHNEEFLNENYDFVIFDTHNDTSKVTLNLLSASHLIVNVATPDGDCFKAINKLITLLEKEIKPKSLIPRSRESVVDVDIAILPNRIKYYGKNLAQNTREFIEELDDYSNVLGIIIERNIFAKSRLLNQSIFELAETEDDIEDFINGVKYIYSEIALMACKKAKESQV